MLNSISKSTRIKVNQLKKIENAGSEWPKIIFFSVSEDYTQLYNTMREKISLVKHDKICPGQGSFGHITGGYDAGYYG